MISNDITIFLTKLNIEPCNVFISGSSILYELNILSGSPNDLDINIMNNKTWNNLKLNFNTMGSGNTEKIFLTNSQINMPFKEVEIYTPIFNIISDKDKIIKKWTDEKILANGLYFISLENLLEFKKSRNYLKDKNHIELIEKYLQKNKV